MGNGRKGKIIAFLCGALVCAAVFTAVPVIVKIYKGPDKEQQITSLIKNYYIGEATDESLTEGKYRGMLDSLGDKYSSYFNEDEYEVLMSNANATNKGIGIYIYIDEETGKAVIAGTIEGTPAEEAGLKENDVIVSVNGESVEGLELEVITGKIRNSEDPVNLVIDRGGEEISYSLHLTDIPDETVVYGFIEGENIGYIYISKFGSNTDTEFKEAYDYIMAEDPDGMIIDLRNNVGGLVDSCVDSLNVFMPGGLLVYTEDKNGKIRNFESDCADPVDIPLVVLVNDRTASAAEIFAGAVQGRNVGTIVGKTTYGKGIVQSIFDLKDGTAVKLTTSSYFTPDGKSLNGEGLKPDVEAEDKDSTEGDEQVEKAVEIIKEEAKSEKAAG